MRFRHLAITTSLATLAAAEPAWAQCTTSTASGVTTITCGSTATTNSTNTNQNNPGTTARGHSFANTINATIPQGVTITGLGLLIQATGNNPITVTNNGTVSHTAGETANGQPVTGLDIIGNGGLVTYLGNGTVTTNATPPSLAAGLSISNSNGGGVNIGSQAAPITGATFSGESGIVVRSPSGSFINAFFHGGTFTSTNTANDAIELSGLGNVNLVMTGQSVLSGSLRVGVFSNAPDASVVSANVDARITETLGPAVTMSGVSGGTQFTLGSAGAITGQAAGVVMFAEGGEIRLTTAAGSTIGATGAAGLGVQLQPDAGAGSILADLGGAITSSGAGLFLQPANGNANVTIRAGASVSGNSTGISVVRLAGRTGVVDILNLGTISSPITAADFDGSLRIGNGGTTGTIQGNITNRGTLIFNRSDALAYGGIVSGTGALTQQGAGTTTLSGVSTYTGATNVNGGTLLVTGSIAASSLITVNNGATLGGTGTLGRTTVASGGFLAPGTSIGTLVVTGDLTFAAGSRLIVEVAPASADRVNVSGLATLAGNVTAIALGGTYAAGNYTLLNALGGISGTFAGLTIQGTFGNFTPSLTYNANNVLLTLAVGGGGGGTSTTTTSTTQQDTFTDVTRPGFAVTGSGPAIVVTQLSNASAGPQGAQLTTFLGNAGLLGPPGAPTLLSSVLTNTATTVTTTVTFGPATILIGPNQSQTFVVQPGTVNVNTNTNTQSFFTRTFQISRPLTQQGANVVAGDLHATFQTALGDDGFHFADRLLARGRGDWGGGPSVSALVGSGLTLWLSGAFADADFEATATSLGFDYDTRNGEIGVEHDGGDWLLGAAFGYGGARIEQDATADNGRIDTWRGGLYAAWRPGTWSLNGAVSVGWHDIDSTRLSGLATPARSSYDARTISVGAEAATRVAIEGGGLDPSAGLVFTSLRVGDFAESGVPLLNLAGADQTIDALKVYAGARLWARLGAVTPELRVRVTHDLLNDRRGYTARFVDDPAGTAIPVTGLQPDRTAVIFGSGFGFDLGRNVRAILRYDAELRGGDNAHRFGAVLDVGF